MELLQTNQPRPKNLEVKTTLQSTVCRIMPMYEVVYDEPRFKIKGTSRLIGYSGKAFLNFRQQKEAVFY